MAFPGAFSTYSTIDTALNDGSAFRVRDVEQRVGWRNKNSAEFYKFLRETKRGAEATQPKHEWTETDKAPNYLIVKARATSGATSIDVFDAYQAVTGEAYYNGRTGEIIRIDAVDDADTISTAATTGFGRGHQNSTAAAMVPGDWLFNMGGLLEEQATAADSRGVTPMAFYNYLEAFQKTWTVTGFQEASQMLDGVGQIDEAYARSMWELDEAVNAAMFFSRRDLSSAALGTLYTMNGLDQQIKTHAFDFGSVLVPTWSLLNEKFSLLFTETASSSEKNFYLGMGAYQAVVNAARSVGIKPENWETLNGTEVMSIGCDGGTVHLIKDYKTFKGPLSTSGRIVDPAHVVYVPYRNFDRVVLMHVENNNQKATVRKDQALQAGTLVVHHESTHGRVDGLGGNAFAGVR